MHRQDKQGSGPGARQGRQQGFSTVLLIVLIVTLAGMTAFALRFVSGAQGMVAADTLARRAQHAAETAVEWQRYRLRNLAGPGNCLASINLVVPLSTGNLTATVTCQRTPAAAQADGVGPANSITKYAITATACLPAGPAGCPNPAPPADYVERQIVTGAACPGSFPAGDGCTW